MVWIRDDTFLHNGVRRVKLDAAETTAEEGAPAAAADTKASADAVSPVRKEAAVEESDHDPAGQIVAISISHDSEYATAVCIGTAWLHAWRCGRRGGGKNVRRN